jgi:hypothetical protein
MTAEAGVASIVIDVANASAATEARRRFVLEWIDITIS